MTRRTVEYRNPHYREKPDLPPEFGKPIIKPKPAKRKPLSDKPTPAPSYELGLFSTEAHQEKALRGRVWETYVLDKGTGTQETIQGRSYTIGKEHSPVDVYSFPPNKPDGVRVGTVQMARIIALKPPKESRQKDESSGELSKRWTDVVVLKGVSKRPIEEPILFDNGFGQSMIVQAEWVNIRRKR